MNAFTFLVVLAVVAAVALVAYRAGLTRRTDSTKRSEPPPAAHEPAMVAAPAPRAEPPSQPGANSDAAAVPHPWAAPSQLDAFAAERARLHGELASARAETARYRQIIVDLERDAPPPLLGAPTAPDDLKLIVGVGPVLERILQQLGVFTYRQIAHWSEHDVDAFEARLPEFPGRIRRDAWVTQARALHQSKYGERP